MACNSYKKSVAMRVAKQTKFAQTKETLYIAIT